MYGAKMQKYFWKGTEDDLYYAGIRIPEISDYILDMQPLWIIREKECYWFKRGLYVLQDCWNAPAFYKENLAGMKLPRKYLCKMDKPSVRSFGNDRLKREYLKDEK